MMWGVSTAVQSQWTVWQDVLITQHYASFHNITSGSNLTHERSGGKRKWMGWRRKARGVRSNNKWLTLNVAITLHFSVLNSPKNWYLYSQYQKNWYWEYNSIFRKTLRPLSEIGFVLWFTHIYYTSGSTEGTWNGGLKLPHQNYPPGSRPEGVLNLLSLWTRRFNMRLLNKCNILDGKDSNNCFLVCWLRLNRCSVLSSSVQVLWSAEFDQDNNMPRIALNNFAWI